MKTGKRKNIRRMLGLTKFEHNWNQKYFELKDFKGRFGHCNVAQTWSENPSLGHWVIRQRVYKSRLTDERIALLDGLGFTWNIFDAVWEESYQKLVLYKEQFGHCNVSKGQEGYIALADWLQKQRKDKKNNAPRLSQYKIDKLEALQIDWFQTVRYGWEYLFAELVRFKNKYGHCQVKQNSREYYTLANWVSFQRQKKNSLSGLQKERLDAIGFVWSVKPRVNNLGTQTSIENSKEAI